MDPLGGCWSDGDHPQCQRGRLGVGGMNTPRPPSQEVPPALEPKPKKDGNDIKWYDKRLVIPSLIIWLVLSGVFYALAMRHKPPEGFVFERAPVLSGIYKCCEAGGRSSASWVGSTAVNCRGFGYYEFLGTNRNDCGFKEQLNGHPVEVNRVYLPSSGDRSPLGVRITSQDQTYYDVSDQRIRELWVSESTSGAGLLAFILALIVHLFLRIYFAYVQKPIPRKGDQ
jgi:hypothetical protein